MDIDIDLADREQLLNVIPHRIAVLANGKKHNTGIYVTEIPHDPVTKHATIDYGKAEKRGYFKIDILNVGIYSHVKSRKHLIELANKEPLWELLEYKEFVDNLFHLSGHHTLLQKTKPKNIEQLAAVLCMIRPAKKYLCDKPWDIIMQEVWTPPDNNEYYFKKSHAFSYAMAVIVHMNLLCEH